MCWDTDRCAAAMFFLYWGLRIEGGLGSKLFCNTEIAKGYCSFLGLFLFVCLFRMVVTTKQCLLWRNKYSALTVWLHTHLLIKNVCISIPISTVFFVTEVLVHFVYSWRLTYKWGNPRKNLSHETWSDRGSNPAQLRDRRLTQST